MYWEVEVAIGYLTTYAWVWPIRRRGDFDLPMDSTARHVRWLTVLVLLGLSERLVRPFPGSDHLAGYSGALQAFQHNPGGMLLAYASLAFFVWPNLGLHLTRLLRWMRVLPPGSPEYIRQLSEARGEWIDPAG